MVAAQVPEIVTVRRLPLGLIFEQIVALRVRPVQVAAAVAYTEGAMPFAPAVAMRLVALAFSVVGKARVATRNRARPFVSEPAKVRGIGRPSFSAGPAGKAVALLVPVVG